MATGVNPAPYTRDLLRLAAHVPGRVGFDDLAGPPLRSPTCGSRALVRVDLDDEHRVIALRQALEACAFGQAAAAVMAEGAAGRTLGEARAGLDALAAWLDGGALPDWPGIAVLEPVAALPGRHGAVLLPFRALVAGIEAAA